MGQRREFVASKSASVEAKGSGIDDAAAEKCVVALAERKERRERVG